MRLLLLAGLFTFSLALTSCQSQCKKVQKNNKKFIAGTHDFGKNKESKKFKKRNRRGS